MIGRAIIVLLGGLLLLGCGGRISPTSTGFHVPNEPLAVGGLRQTCLLWSTGRSSAELAALAYLTTALASGNHRVVERAQVDRIFAEQGFRLMYTPDREADLIHVGRMAGATQIIFVAIEADRLWAGEPHQMTVSLRGVDVESGVVRWMGRASAAVDNALYSLGPAPDAATRLTFLALSRALCPVEQGHQWIEPDEAFRGGCIGPGARSSSHVSRPN